VIATKLPRTIRLDPSDTFVFDRPAEPGEWAVTGSFLFIDTDPTSLTGRPEPLSGPASRACPRSASRRSSW
jgi:hypothetical protein